MTIPIAGPAVTVTGCVELFCSTPGTLCSGFRVLQEDWTCPSPWGTTWNHLLEQVPQTSWLGRPRCFLCMFWVPGAVTEDRAVTRTQRLLLQVTKHLKTTRTVSIGQRSCFSAVFRQGPWPMSLGVSLCRGFTWRVRDVSCCQAGSGLPLVAIPISTSLFQVVETLQPETPVGSNSCPWADQEAWPAWLLRELELVSTKMQNDVNDVISWWMPAQCLFPDWLSAAQPKLPVWFYSM